MIFLNFDFILLFSPPLANDVGFVLLSSDNIKQLILPECAQNAYPGILFDGTSGRPSPTMYFPGVVKHRAKFLFYIFKIGNFV